MSSPNQTFMHRTALPQHLQQTGAASAAAATASSDAAAPSTDQNDDGESDSNIMRELTSSSESTVAKLLQKNQQRKAKVKEQKLSNKREKEKQFLAHMEEEMGKLQRSSAGPAAATAASADTRGAESAAPTAATDDDDDEFESTAVKYDDGDDIDEDDDHMIGAAASASGAYTQLELSWDENADGAAASQETKKQRKVVQRKSKEEIAISTGVHQLFVLIMLNYGMHLNRLAGDELLLSCLLSILPSSFSASHGDAASSNRSQQSKFQDSDSEDEGEPVFYVLKSLMTFLRKRFTVAAPAGASAGSSPASPLSTNAPKSTMPLESPLALNSSDLLDAIQQKQPLTKLQFFVVCLASFRALGYAARLTCHLDPSPCTTIEEKPKRSAKKRKGDSGEVIVLDDTEEDTEEKAEPAASASTAPASKKRKRSTAIKSVKKDEEDEDEEEVSVTRKRRGRGGGAAVVSAPKKGKKESSSSAGAASSASPTSPKQPNLEILRNNTENIWIEVWSQSDKKWIHVDAAASCDIKMLENPASIDISNSLTVPLPTFVVALGSNGYMHDVTLRYKVQQSQPAIYAQEQYDATLSWFAERVLRRLDKTPLFQQQDDDEDCVLVGDSTVADISSAERQAALDDEKKFSAARTELQKRLPSTQDAYKRHPLYVIEKWLLRYEAFYPDNPPIVGWCNKLPVFERKYVHELHTKDLWLQEGRVVRADEKPYKLVKASALSQKANTELFGMWQTDAYVVPEAKDGLVPKNERGQVDLWNEKFLPKGTVHMKLPGLGKIAKKLGIDYAPAMTGFDIRSKRTVPVIEGVVVCAEYEQTLREAYIESKKIAYDKARAKIDKRVNDNWKKLIVGLLTRKKIHERYGLESAQDSQGAAGPASAAAAAVAKPQKKGDANEPIDLDEEDIEMGEASAAAAEAVPTPVPAASSLNYRIEEDMDEEGHARINGQIVEFEEI